MLVIAQREFVEEAEPFEVVMILNSKAPHLKPGSHTGDLLLVEIRYDCGCCMYCKTRDCGCLDGWVFHDGSIRYVHSFHDCGVAAVPIERHKEASAKVRAFFANRHDVLVEEEAMVAIRGGGIGPAMEAREELP